MTLSELYNYAEQRHIDIDNRKMRELVSAAFPENWIVLDRTKIPTSAEEKAILAHEIGHCVTGAFYGVSSPPDFRAKQEQKANEWAYRKLVPHDALLEAVKQGDSEIWQLAEHFGVPYDFMQHAVEYWRQIEAG